MSKEDDVQCTMENKKLVFSTRFEDLSNELMYDIFDYLESWQIYEIFVQLNIRFQHLFISPTFRLHVNLSSISKKNYLHRCEQLVKGNMNRIVSLSLSNSSSIGFFLKLFSIESFIHIERLIINGVTSNNLLVRILNSLVLLPRLFTISITSLIFEQDENLILQCIFRLSVIKYCKLTYDGNLNRKCLPCAHDKNSQSQTLKYLIIDGDFSLNQLTPILTYTPQLTYFSCRFRSGIDYETHEELFLPINLTDVILKYHDVSFDEIEKFLSKISHRLQRLRLTTHMNKTFLCADRWERLIVTHMPHLYIFDFMYSIIKYDPPDNYIISNQVFDRFKSSFWTNRNWFFRYQHWFCKNDDFEGIFYSTHPYRRQCYELYRCETYEMIINSASHLKIGIDKIPADIVIRFPNVTKLTLIENDSQSNEQRSIMNINRIIPLIQLTHLVIFDRHFDIIQLIEFLRFSSNIQSLTCMGVSFIDLFCLSIEQIDLVNCISKTSKVTKLCIQDDCSLEYVQFFVNLCPRLQKVDIVPLKRQIESIVRFLLSSNVPDLFRLSLQSTTYETKAKLQKMIDRDKLICDYSIKDHYTGLHLWW